MFLKDKKNSKIFTNSKKSLNFLDNSKIPFSFFKKKKRKNDSVSKKNFKNESFLPITSSFEISQNLELSTQWTKPQKIGEFFPKEKKFYTVLDFSIFRCSFFLFTKCFFSFCSKKTKNQKIFFLFNLFKY